uniref:Uncharacterized protein n=1 Tax=Staphylococcus phage 184DA TaxID=3110532 RepID=A0AAU6MXS1_9CAUD
MNFLTRNNENYLGNSCFKNKELLTIYFISYKKRD